MTRPRATIALGDGARARVAVLFAVVCVACSDLPSPYAVRPNILGPCSRAAPPNPAVHLGPDATIRVLCGAPGTAAVASVDERGSGTTSWSVSLRGAPAGAFTTPQSSFQTCQLRGNAVAFVDFQPPDSARPGDAFEAVVTVHADDGSFADGTVNVHAEVVTPSVRVDKPTIEFGDMRPGSPAQQVITFVASNPGVSILSSTTKLDLPFSYNAYGAMRDRPNVTTFAIDFESLVPGDFSTSIDFATTAPVLGPPACDWRMTIPLHARVVDPGDVADGGAAEDDAPIAEAAVD